MPPGRDQGRRRRQSTRVPACAPETIEETVSPEEARRVARAALEAQAPAITWDEWKQTHGGFPVAAISSAAQLRRVLAGIGMGTRYNQEDLDRAMELNNGSIDFDALLRVVRYLKAKFFQRDVHDSDTARAYTAVLAAEGVQGAGVPLATLQESCDHFGLVVDQDRLAALDTNRNGVLEYNEFAALFEESEEEVAEDAADRRFVCGTDTPPQPRPPRRPPGGGDWRRRSSALVELLRPPPPPPAVPRPPPGARTHAARGRRESRARRESRVRLSPAAVPQEPAADQPPLSPLQRSVASVPCAAGAAPEADAVSVPSGSPAALPADGWGSVEAAPRAAKRRRPGAARGKLPPVRLTGRYDASGRLGARRMCPYLQQVEPMPSPYAAQRAAAGACESRVLARIDRRIRELQGGQPLRTPRRRRLPGEAPAERKPLYPEPTSPRHLPTLSGHSKAGSRSVWRGSGRPHAVACFDTLGR
eukprot:TRINITY_DN16693_c0_g1_i1.p1 TRINITY_DN16693_c0_g1~~TRINITY_DN16693_c0_g1_i1.p1  ORF type:complete len:508 (+),score=102.63 TRINITY_DN16693_c0_g1_i1:101-1525(+)